MAERYTCVRHRLGRVSYRDRGLIVGLLMVLHNKILDGIVKPETIETEGVVLEARDLFDIAGGPFRTGRLLAKLSSALARNETVLGQVVATSVTTSGAKSVRVQWPNFQRFLRLRRKNLALIYPDKRLSESNQNQRERSLSRPPERPSGAAGRAGREQEAEKIRRSEALAAVIQEFTTKGIVIDEAALLADFPIAYEQSKGNGAIGWFVKQRTEGGRWAPS